MPTLDGKVVEDAQTLEERVQCATHCVDALALQPIPTLVDDLGDSAERAYEAWPDRLFVIDREGRVAFRSPPGPFGFDLEELEKAIQGELKRDSRVGGKMD